MFVLNTLPSSHSQVPSPKSQAQTPTHFSSHPTPNHHHHVCARPERALTTRAEGRLGPSLVTPLRSPYQAFGAECVLHLRLPRSTIRSPSTTRVRSTSMSSPTLDRFLTQLLAASARPLRHPTESPSCPPRPFPPTLVTATARVETRPSIPFQFVSVRAVKKSKKLRKHPGLVWKYRSMENTCPLSRLQEFITTVRVSLLSTKSSIQHQSSPSLTGFPCSLVSFQSVTIIFHVHVHHVLRIHHIRPSATETGQQVNPSFKPCPAEIWPRVFPRLVSPTPPYAHSIQSSPCSPCSLLKQPLPSAVFDSRSRN